jgi:hypothetical protein
VARLQRSAGRRVSPPVVGPRGPLTDVLVHGGDMRVPLGLPHDPGADGVRAALQFVTGGRPVGFVPRGRLTGLRLVAEDVDVAHGEGAAVHGRGIDLLMAVCGRRALLHALRGPGVPVLARRLSAAQAGSAGNDRGSQAGRCASNAVMSSRCRSVRPTSSRPSSSRHRV